MFFDPWRPAGGAALIIAVMALAPMHAMAGDEFLASAQLRGGFDANPMLLPTGKRGSAFAGLSATFAAGRGDAANGYGVVGELERTDYSERGTAPFENYKLELKGMSEFSEGWSLRSSTTTAVSRNYSLQAFDAGQSLKLKAPEGPLRPFVNAAVQYSTLNETSPLLGGDFLPSPMRFGRASINPGLIVNLGKGAIGGSVEVSATRYAEEPDLFGFKRNNERLEPFLFAAFSDQGLEFFGSVSRLHGQWHDPNFTPVRETMFETSLSKQAGAFRLNLTAQRAAQDTTFPISPLAIATRQGVELGYRFNDNLEARVFGRGVRVAYHDTPFTSSVQEFGAGLAYALQPGLTLGAEVTHITGSGMDGAAINGGIALLSLRKVIAGAAQEPPSALATNPSWDPRPAKTIR